MEVSIRKFDEKDISKKIEWINNPENNKYLHFDLPLEYDKTKHWYENASKDNNRYDGIIVVGSEPCGIIGLLNINPQVRSAEYYVTIGEKRYKGKGISIIAGKKMVQYAFEELDLVELYLYTEKENIIAQKSFENIGFQQCRMFESERISKLENNTRYKYILLRTKCINEKRG